MSRLRRTSPEWYPQGTRHRIDRKSTRLNSSHLVISYAVFCLKKKNRLLAVDTVQLLAAVLPTALIQHLLTFLLSRPDLLPDPAYCLLVACVSYDDTITPYAL